MRSFETERLIIRRFTKDDWKDLYEYLSKEEVVKYEPYDVYTEEQSIEESIYRSQQECFWAVCLKDNNKLIGNVYFQQQEPKEFLTWEIGYVFNSEYFGQGYATESCKEIMRYGFEELNARRMVSMCNPKNSASWRLLERLNMRREGHLKKNIYFKYDENGEPIWNDTYEYGILAEEWTNISLNSGYNFSGNKIYFATKALIIKDKKFLACHKSTVDYEEYELPGGRLEFGESAEDTLQREIKEEINLCVEPIKILDTWNYIGEAHQIVGIIYLCKIRDGILTLSDEHDKFQWVPFNKDSINCMHKVFREKMEKWDFDSIIS